MATHFASPASSSSSSRMKTRRFRNQDGFTLIEMLTVIVILTLAAGVALPALRQRPDRLDLETVARRISATMRLAQAQAVARNAETAVTINAAARQIVSHDGSVLQWPVRISVEVVAARPERRGRSSVGMRFFPDGTSTGGTITLTSRNRRADIEVNWLTGEAVLELSDTPK